MRSTEKSRAVDDTIFLLLYKGYSYRNIYETIGHKRSFDYIQHVKEDLVIFRAVLGLNLDRIIEDFADTSSDGVLRGRILRRAVSNIKEMDAPDDFKEMLVQILIGGTCDSDQKEYMKRYCETLFERKLNWEPVGV